MTQHDSIPRRCVWVEFLPPPSLQKGYMDCKMSPTTLRKNLAISNRTVPSCCSCSWVKQQSDNWTDQTLLHFTIQKHLNATFPKKIRLYCVQKHLSFAIVLYSPLNAALNWYWTCLQDMPGRLRSLLQTSNLVLIVYFDLNTAASAAQLSKSRLGTARNLYDRILYLFLNKINLYSCYFLR